MGLLANGEKNLRAEERKNTTQNLDKYLLVYEVQDGEGLFEIATF